MEGRHTEPKVYPKWLAYLLPMLTQVKRYDEAVANNYFMISGKGYPSMLSNHLKSSVEEINEIGVYDYLVLCLDGDDVGVESRKKEVLEFMKEENILLNENTKFEIIIQEKCIETWFLGNQSIFKQNPQNEKLASYVNFYNVKKNNPELMDKIPGFKDSVSGFHEEYFRLLLHERSVNYSKQMPGAVVEQYFLKAIQKRHQGTTHLQSFGNFIIFCEKIAKEIQDKN